MGGSTRPTSRRGSPRSSHRLGSDSLEALNEHGRFPMPVDCPEACESSIRGYRSLLRIGLEGRVTTNLDIRFRAQQTISLIDWRTSSSETNRWKPVWR